MNKSKLPYVLPKSLPEQLRLLSKITNIPFPLIKDGGELEIEAISGVILHRHLNRFQKMESLSLIREVGKENRPLEGRLIDLVVDTKVNPQWGIWSLSNDELLSDQNFHNTIDAYASFIGITASVAGSKTIIENIWKRKKINKGGVATLAIYGALYFNYTELSKANEEIKNRSQLKSSPVY
jgi:hypothetical protein